MKLRSVKVDRETRRIRRRLVLGDAVIISNGQLMSKHDLFGLFTTCIAQAHITSSFLSYRLYFLQAGEKQKTTHYAILVQVTSFEHSRDQK